MASVLSQMIPVVVQWYGESVKGHYGVIQFLAGQRVCCPQFGPSVRPVQWVWGCLPWPYSGWGMISNRLTPLAGSKVKRGGAIRLTHSMEHSPS